MRRSTDLQAPLPPLIASVIVAIIIIPKKKTSSSCVKEKRKAETRAGLTKPAIVAAAAKLIESVGANGFSLRKLAKALGVGPTTVHFHFEGGVGSVFSAVAQQALAGVTRPFKPKEEPAGYLGELLLKTSRRCTLDRPSPSSSLSSCRRTPYWIPCSPNDCSWLWPRSACRRRRVQKCSSGRWASSSK